MEGGIILEAAAMRSLHRRRSLFARAVTVSLLLLASTAGAALISYDDTQVATGRVGRAWVVGVLIEVGDNPILINAFSTLDLSSIKTMTIGLGNPDNPRPGGIGQMYIVNVHLTRQN